MTVIALPNSSATWTASWPVIASTTSRVSCGLKLLLEVLDLLGHVLVELQVAGGVDDDGRGADAPRFGEGVLGELLEVVEVAGEDGDVVLAAEGQQLLAGGDAVGVGGDEQGLAAALAQVERRAWQRRSSCRRP